MRDHKPIQPKRISTSSSLGAIPDSAHQAHFLLAFGITVTCLRHYRLLLSQRNDSQVHPSNCPPWFLRQEMIWILVPKYIYFSSWSLHRWPNLVSIATPFRIFIILQTLHFSAFDVKYVQSQGGLRRSLRVQ
jgi:hypothetical protein